VLALAYQRLVEIKGLAAGTEICIMLFDVQFLVVVQLVVVVAAAAAAAVVLLLLLLLLLL